MVGPEEEIDPISNEPRRKRYSASQRLKMAVWTYWHPKQAAEKKAYNDKIQRRIDIRRAKRKAQEEEMRLRDVNNKHGPYCFCGCRSFFKSVKARMKVVNICPTLSTIDYIGIQTSLYSDQNVN